MDFSQYGGLKGQSTSHYLIDLVNFILFNQDLKKPQATLAILYDFSKAFNRQDHNILVTILSDMGTPGWLLKIVMAFLTDRKMILRYRGCTSEEENLPGGGPQGTELGLYLFLILINFAGYKPNQICQNLGEAVTMPKKKKICRSQQKYIDDMTQCEAIDLRKSAILDPNPTLPRQFHQRTGHILPPANNPIQEQVYELQKYAKDHGMKINYDKTKQMLFNTAKTIDVLPQVHLKDDNYVELVDETKLLGMMITSDLKWKTNTNKLVAKAYQRVWMLRNLKRYGATEEHLVEVYFQQVRSLLEQDCPVWNAGITEQDSIVIERVQRTAVAIIRGEVHTSYKDALIKLELETLKSRRENLCLNFAIKAYKHPKFRNWFCTNHTDINTRSEKLPLKEIKTRTRRYKRSPLPYLTTLLNKYIKNKVNVST